MGVTDLTDGFASAALDAPGFPQPTTGGRAMLSFLDAETVLPTVDKCMWRDVAATWLLATLGLACLLFA
jgi:hypothetical protein